MGVRRPSCARLRSHSDHRLCSQNAHRVFPQESCKFVRCPLSRTLRDPLRFPPTSNVPLRFATFSRTLDELCPEHCSVTGRDPQSQEGKMSDSYLLNMIPNVWKSVWFGTHFTYMYPSRLLNPYPYELFLLTVVFFIHLNSWRWNC